MNEAVLNMQTLQAQVVQLALLVQEVRQWHCDPDSAEFNDCENEPCAWCEQAIQVLSR